MARTGPAINTNAIRVISIKASRQCVDLFVRQIAGHDGDWNGEGLGHLRTNQCADEWPGTRLGGARAEDENGNRGVLLEQRHHLMEGLALADDELGPRAGDLVDDRRGFIERARLARKYPSNRAILQI